MKQYYNFYTDARLRINVWEDPIAKLTGKPSYTVLGKKYYEVLPRIFARNRDALSAALEQQRRIALRRYGFHCLHGRIEADITIRPLKDREGKIRKIKVAVAPYTTCHMAEKFQNLQQLIDIGKSASTLAHGVRNPLNAIKGAVVYLRQKYGHEQTLNEFTKIMEDEILKLDTFVSKFLSASGADAEVSEVDINDMIRKLEVFTSLQARAHRITTTYAFGDVPPLTISPFQFEQAMLNIINNAMEAMPCGGTLAIATRTERRFGIDFAVIEISDTGPGIAESRIGADLSPSGEQGRGFGMFIAREILRYYNGHLEILSKKDTGTTVRLYLPIMREGAL
ncbi:MAG: two-component system sensor histidine kinase NtrB [Nitrospirota bacterium]